MPDGSIECILGRMEVQLEDLKEHIAEIREEQKDILTYINSQKAGFRILTFLAVTLGSVFVYYKEHLEQIIFGTGIKNP